MTSDDGEDAKPKADDLKSRPPGFTFATLAVVLQAVIGFIGFKPAFPFGLIAAVSATLIYPVFFWRGSNWARGVVMLVSAADFLLIFLDFTKHDHVKIISDIMGLPLAVFLLYWLNKASVKTYFNGHRRCQMLDETM
jgi:hypothetical protein